ncbi:hypothetical protein CcCBS67573_g10146 [Chytriomyces confervae]|uniref:DUF7703 domain-containing protein n=1 Tax=Chytriomyces confervae TaxID=246404 RepID=A0A507DFK4_9FUNG|nr:hypothetical protein CcCBS67573_g10146 [Chytriomyces confervae]
MTQLEEMPDRTMDVVQIVGAVISMYNAVEVYVCAFSTFKKYNTLYCWSVLACATGLLLQSISWMFIYYKLYSNKYLIMAIVASSVGWWAMVTGFSLTLYSRLTIVDVPRAYCDWIRNLIIFNFLFCHLPTTMFTFGARMIGTDVWVTGYSVIEKIQVTMFLIQEVILSSMYVIHVGQGYGKEMKTVKRHTLYVNILVLILDLVVVIVEYAGLFAIQVALKVAVYSIKIKLEFLILRQLTDANKAFRRSTLGPVRSAGNRTETPIKSNNGLGRKSNTHAEVFTSGSAIAL